MLEDVLAEGLAVVFCGTSSGDKSVRIPAYYAGRGNKFWHVLFRTKLTPRQFRPEEYQLVLAHDIGLTDLVKRAGVPGVEDVFDGKDPDAVGFRKKMAENRPSIIGFNGKEAAKRCIGVDSVDYGRQKAPFEKAVVYVLPSTADQAHDYWDESHWTALAAEVRKLRNAV